MLYRVHMPALDVFEHFCVPKLVHLPPTNIGIARGVSAFLRKSEHISASFRLDILWLLFR